MATSLQCLTNTTVDLNLPYISSTLMVEAMVCYNLVKKILYWHGCLMCTRMRRSGEHWDLHGQVRLEAWCAVNFLRFGNSVTWCNVVK